MLWYLVSVWFEHVDPHSPFIHPSIYSLIYAQSFLFSCVTIYILYAILSVC